MAIKEEYPPMGGDFVTGANPTFAQESGVGMMLPLVSMLLMFQQKPDDKPMEKPDRQKVFQNLLYSIFQKEKNVEDALSVVDDMQKAVDNSRNIIGAMSW